jgi:hypothetical protein
MIRFIKKLFEKKPTIVISDVDFGDIVFIEVKNNPSNSYWEMNNILEFSEGKINFMAIPGNEEGPHDYARKLILEKCSSLNQIWQACQSEIEEQIKCWYPDYIGKPNKEIFDLVAVNVEDQDQWEVSFEAKPSFKWVYLSYQFRGSVLVSGTVDT